MEYIGLKSGCWFGIVPLDKVMHISLKKTNIVVTMYNAEPYNGLTLGLHQGKTWEDVKKIDRLLDEYGDFPIKDYIR